MAIIYLGIGSNLGNRRKNIKEAIASLNKYSINVIKSSTIIETESVGGTPGQGMFLNGVLETQTELDPYQLLHTLKQIEVKLGRKETVKNGPRLIDLDILLYNHQKLKTPQLTIPHPRMFERDFVMKPLNEIAPNLVKELSYANC